MKKHFSLFLVMLVVFVLSASNTRALERDKNLLGYSPTGGYTTGGANTVIKDVKPAVTTIDNTAPVALTNDDFADKAQVIRADSDMKMSALLDSLKKAKDQKTAQVQIKRLESRMNTLKKFDNTSGSVERSKNNIATQIPKLQALGVDTANEEASLAMIQSKIDEAKFKYAELSKILVSTTDNFSKKQNSDISQLLNQAQGLIKSAHTMLYDVVKILMKKVKEQKTCGFKSLIATPNKVQEGGVSTLSWSTFGAKSYDVSSVEVETGAAGPGFGGTDSDLNLNNGHTGTDAIWVTTEYTFNLTCNDGSKRSRSVKIEVPKAEESICDYAAPPQGCEYTPGPDYNQKNKCGMILQCINAGSGTNGFDGPTDKNQ